MEKICIFLERVCDATAQIANSKENGAEKFPFYNNRYSGTCKTETIKFEINNVPTCRMDTSYFNNSLSELSAKIRNMRLECNITATELSNKTGVNSTTISRYENDQFSIDKIDIDILSRLSIACDKDENYLLTPFLMFKKYHKQILEQYLIDNNISKKQLSQLCGVSYTLVKTWFNKEKRSPSYELWQTTFEDYVLDWLKHNIDYINHGF